MHTQPVSLVSRARAFAFVTLFAVTASGLMSSGLAQAQENTAKAAAPSAPQVTAPKTGPTAGSSTSSPSKGVFRLPIPPRNFRPPVIEIAEATWDWGSVVKGAIVTHTFKVTNKGGSQLIIDNVKALKN